MLVYKKCIQAKCIRARIDLRLWVWGFVPMVSLVVRPLLVLRHSCQQWKKLHLPSLEAHYLATCHLQGLILIFIDLSQILVRMLRKSWKVYENKPRGSKQECKKSETSNNIETARLIVCITLRDVKLQKRRANRAALVMCISTNSRRWTLLQIMLQRGKTMFRPRQRR